jgi:ketol-acid reductoisomerase
MHIVIIGFGSQAKAWALNLKDSGENVYIALRESSPSIKEAKDLGLKTLILGPDLLDFNTFAVLTPDSTHEKILNDYKEFINKDSKIILAHGFSFVKNSFQEVYPNWNFLMLAPKAIASEVRFQFETKGKLGGVFSVESSKNKESDTKLLKELARAIGITAGPYETTFKNEAFADLYSEQSILCSLIPYGALHSFKKLREKGISKEMAYLECWYEVKLITDALIKLGPSKFFNLISPNALIGGEKAKNLLFNKEFEAINNQLIEDIWSGKFFKEVEEIDFENLKKEVKTFWENEEITKVHNELSGELFS